MPRLFEQRRRASVSHAGVRPQTVDGRTRASPFSYDYRCYLTITDVLPDRPKHARTSTPTFL